MKIAILGATGWIGSTIMGEALNRDHQVIAISRSARETEQSGVEMRSFNVLSQGDLSKAVASADLVISAVGGRADGNHDMVASTAERLLQELPVTGIKRLIWVGGAGSLEVAPGIELVTVPEFPAEYRGEAIAQKEALEVFRNSESKLDWLFVSPAAEIFPGERSGIYRVGGDQLLTDAEGNSKVSVQDYAVAILDEVENPKHKNERIGIAY